MKKTKSFVSLILWITAILCRYSAKTNALQLSIDDNFFGVWGISTWNYAEIHFQENGNDWYWLFFIWNLKDITTQLNLSSTDTITCHKQLRWYYVIPYTNYQMLWLDTGTVNYTETYSLTSGVNILSWWLFYNCKRNNTLLKGVYWYIKREYWSNSDVKNIHEIRAWIYKDWQGNYHRKNTSPLQLTYSTTTWNTSKTMSWQFYSSIARIGNVSPRAIWDIKFTNNAVDYVDGVYKISRYDYVDPNVWMSLKILSAKSNQNWIIKLEYFDTNGQIQTPQYINITTDDSLNNYGFHWETNLVITDPSIASWIITLLYSWENGNPDRSFSARFEITEDWFTPCANRRDNDYFLTQDFRTPNPSKNNIKCAIFWYSWDYKTAYTTWRNGYDYDNPYCTEISVIITWSLPSNWHIWDRVIYVLSGNSDENTINIAWISMWECSAIISPSKLNIWNDTTINLNSNQITFGSNSKFSILDNISIKWQWWISLIGGTNSNTLNMVKVYNASNWIYLDNSHHIILNNIQSLNNNVWIYIKNSTNNAINNTQVYRNGTWIYMEGATNNIIYNSNITLNNIWLFVTVWSNYNIFKSLLVNWNRIWSVGKNIYIKNWLNNDCLINNWNCLINNWINITQWDNYFMEYTWKTDVFSWYRTSLELTWYTWIMKRSAAKFSYNYECEWWTIWTCYLQAKKNGNYDYYLSTCTGTRHTVEEEWQTNSYRYIVANWIINGFSWNATRNIEINSWAQEFHTITPEHQISLDISNWSLW